MSLGVLRTMLIGLFRDRGALALSFVLPVAFFLVFASIFGGGSGDATRLDIAIADEGGNEESGRLVRALSREPALRLVDKDGKPAGDPLPRLNADDARALVKTGKADVGLVVRANIGSSMALFGGGAADEPPPLTLVEDSAKGIAGQIVIGLIQKSYVTALPDLTAQSGVSMLEERVGGLTPEQKKKWEKAVGELRKDALEADHEGESGGSDIEEAIEIEQVTGKSAGQNQIAYYAGAVAVMFLLFSSAHGAVVLLEEKDSGIVDRIIAGPGGMAPLINGKFLFLVLSGFVQVTVIFIVAWQLRSVDLPGHFLGFALVTLATCAAAAGLALALAASCRSKRQADSVATIVILILSAVGGSMVPRFFMPPLFRTLGWFTPNTWALEAYTKVFWRDEPIVELWLPLLVLGGVALAGYLVTRVLTRRWESL